MDSFIDENTSLTLPVRILVPVSKHRSSSPILFSTVLSAVAGSGTGTEAEDYVMGWLLSVKRGSSLCVAVCTTNASMLQVSLRKKLPVLQLYQQFGLADDFRHRPLPARHVQGGKDAVFARDSRHAREPRGKDSLRVCVHSRHDGAPLPQPAPRPEPTGIFLLCTALSSSSSCSLST